MTNKVEQADSGPVYLVLPNLVTIWDNAADTKEGKTYKLNLIYKII